MLRITALAVMLGLETCGFSAPSGLPNATRVDSTAVQQTFQGTILFVNEDKLILATEGGTTTFLVPPGVKVWRDGVPASLADLSWRDVATVLADPIGDGLVAGVIVANSPM